MPRETGARWPDSKARKHRMDSRALHLRHALGLPDQGHPLESSRGIRKIFIAWQTDFDEQFGHVRAAEANRLKEAWWRSDNLETSLGCLLIGDSDLRTIRYHDAKTHAVMFLDKTVNLRETRMKFFPEEYPSTYETQHLSEGGDHGNAHDLPARTRHAATEELSNP